MVDPPALDCLVVVAVLVVDPPALDCPVVAAALVSPVVDPLALDSPVVVAALVILVDPLLTMVCACRSSVRRIHFTSGHYIFSSLLSKLTPSPVPR